MKPFEKKRTEAIFKAARWSHCGILAALIRVCRRQSAGDREVRGIVKEVGGIPQDLAGLPAKSVKKKV